jgi:outer membrane biogenesis lipoprotein LolB
MTVFSFIHSRYKVLLGLWISAILFGCSLYPDVNNDPAKNNKATFQQDALDCAQSYPETGSGVYVRQRIGCMNMKGWH